MYDSFTSLSPEEERTFLPFEQRMQDASRSATVIGFGLAGGIGLLALLIVLAFWGPITQPGEEAAGQAPAGETAK
jgi:hypothetical protein